MTIAAPPLAPLVKSEKKSRQRRFNALTIAGGVIIATLALVAIVAPPLAADLADTINTSQARQGPSVQHLFGTDGFGRDVLIRTLVAARLTMLLTAGAGIIAITCGTLLGVLTSLLPPWLRRIVLQLNAVAVTLPSMVLALVVAAIMGPGSVSAMLAVGIANIPIFIRLTSMLSAGVAQQDYVVTARLLGVPTGRIAVRHILPNIATPLSIIAASSMAFTLVELSSLSFIGLGVQVPDYDWGKMLYDGIALMNAQPGAIVGPSVLIALLGLGIMLLGDGIAAQVDPKIRLAARASRGRRTSVIDRLEAALQSSTAPAAKTGGGSYVNDAAASGGGYVNGAAASGASNNTDLEAELATAPTAETGGAGTELVTAPTAETGGAGTELVTAPTAETGAAGTELATEPTAEPKTVETSPQNAEAVVLQQLQITTVDGAELVRGVSLAIKPGEILGLVGESGSGKSLTALSVAGLPPPGLKVQAVGARIGETELTTTLNTAGLAHTVALVYQDPMSTFSPLHSIGSQLTEVRRTHFGLSRKAARAELAEAFAQVSITQPKHRLRQYPHELSGGMLQRALIAGALLTHPVLLVADEPTTALDVTVQADVLRKIRRFREDTGAAVLFISHDLGVIEAICDRVLVMYQGQVVEEITAAQLASRKVEHPYTQRL
ncbi:MAG: ATP-binding cassette domain-containing protein, partial [Bifidobacteriaceae bacterium]|nr:ATP-binding cassette domain-containing protein [Bifidobacteriaceae bacterium]